MRRILPALIASIVWARPATAELRGGSFNVQYERTFRDSVTVLAATDQFLFISDSGSDPNDKRPQGVPRQAKDLTVEGYSANFRQSIIRMLLCNRLTGEIVHEFPGPVSRRPRVSGFELPLTSPPVFLDDGFVFLTADWHLQRIKLPASGGKPAQVWDLDIPAAAKLTPRLNDDVGYLMPEVRRCGEALVFAFNAAPAPDQGPVHLTVASVNLSDGKLNWTRHAGPAGSIDRSPTCVPASEETFHVVTSTGDIQTFSLDGSIHGAFRPAGEYRPRDPADRWRGENWELHRLDKTRLLAFAGESPEFGRGEPCLLCCVSVKPDGSMNRLWQSAKIRGSVAAPATGTNLYLRSGESLTAFSMETGKELWDKPAEDIGTNWAPPVVHNGFVYFPDTEGLRVFRDAPECSLLGTVEFVTPHKNGYSTHMPSGFCAPIIHGGSLYVAVGEKVYALKLPLFP